MKVKAWARYVFERAVFVLEYTNTLSMARNLTVPLFQDNSSIGKIISLFIRATWVWIGGMVSAFLIIPLLLGLLMLVLLPLMTVSLLIMGIYNLFVVN